MRVAVNGVELYFDVEGAALVPDGAVMRERPTLVLLHGGPGADHATYKPFMSAFADQAQLIYIDHRGNGRSDISVPEKWNLAQWADDVAGFLDAVDIHKPYVLGASFGGFVAQAFATTYPDRVSKLVLMCTGPRTDADLSAQVFAELGGTEVGEVARQYLSQTGGADIEAEYFRLCLPHYAVNDFDLVALGRSIERPDVRRHFFAPGGEWHTMDFRPALARVECPTLILHGELDPILPLALARELETAIRPGLSQLQIIANAGHGPTDEPDQWHTALQSFLFET